MLNIVSLGAGVQSSTIALMIEAGELPQVDAYIFADTQNEPKAVIQWLDWLETQLTAPVYRVTTGDLGADFLAALQNEKGRCGQPPFFVRNPDNDGTAAAVSGGMLWRKCTSEYKLAPIRRKVRELSSGQPVRQWIGISLDEAHRMKPSGVKYIKNYYPLVDLRITRGDCLAWMKRHNYPSPPKSACYFCPYTSDGRWIEMKRSAPDEWQRAVEFDEALRKNRSKKINGAGIKGEIFVHRSMKPLSVAEFGDDKTIDMFGNECEGMCGV